MIGFTLYCNIIHLARLFVLLRDVGLRGSSGKSQPLARWISWGPCAAWILVQWLRFESLEVFFRGVLRSFGFLGC